MTMTPVEGADLDTGGGEGPTRNRTGPPVDKLKDDPFAKRIEQLWKEGSEAMQAVRRQFWLSLAFYEGEQWIWWSKSRQTVQNYPVTWSPLGPGRAKVTVNRIEANTNSLLARFVKSELGWNVAPSTPDDDAVMGAQVSEKVLRAYTRTEDWDMVRFDELFAMLMGGTSAVAIEWDAAAGTTIDYDDSSGQVTGTGDVVLSALDVTEFCVEPNVRDYRQARWWIQAQAHPAEYVQEHYGLDWTPKPDAGTQMSALQHKLLSEQGRSAGKNLTMVFTYYERPHRGRKGQYGVVVNGVTIVQEAWPFPFEDLNLECFRMEKIGGRWLGATVMTSAIPLQFAYNHARSVLAEHMKLTGNARLMAPYGAFDEEDLTDNPADVLWWSPDVQGAKPEYLVPPQLPRWMIQEADTISQELDDIMHVHGVSRGQGYPRASAQALAFLAEKDDSPLSVMGMEQKRGWSNLGSKVLKLLEAKGQETRSKTIRVTEGVSELVRWTGQELRGQTQADVDPDSVLPHSSTAREAFAKDLWDRQILTDPRRYARMVGLESDQFEELLDADAARANRENFRMAQGRIELPFAFDDHAVHMSEHNRWRKSDAYKFAPPEIRQLFDQHIAYHQNSLHEEFGRQVALGQINPALAALPRGDEPIGSQMPPDSVEGRAAQMRGMAPGGQGTPPQPGQGPEQGANKPPGAGGQGLGDGGQQQSPAQQSEIAGRGRSQGAPGGGG